MAKPIFVIEVSNQHTSSMEEMDEFAKALQKQFADYYCLIIPTDSDENKFHCFHEKDIDEIKFAELKDFVAAGINKKSEPKISERGNHHE